MATALEEEWNDYFFQLDETERKSVLLLLKTFLRRKSDNRVSLDKYNKEIDNALSEVASGNYITQEEMEKRAGKW